MLFSPLSPLKSANMSNVSSCDLTVTSRNLAVHVHARTIHMYMHVQHVCPEILADEISSKNVSGLNANVWRIECTHDTCLWMESPGLS